MFKSIVTGKIENDPEFKKINGKLCCNFELIAISKYSKKEVRSVVRCSVWNNDAERMKNVKKGDYIIGIGDSSNVAYEPNGEYVFNVNITNLEIIDIA